MYAFRYIIIGILFFTISEKISAQTISFSFPQEFKERVLIGNVFFYEGNNNSYREHFTFRQNNLSYNLKNTYKELVIRIRIAGFIDYERVIRNPETDSTYHVKAGLELLLQINEVTVSASKRPVTLKGDTTIFDVSAYKTGSERKIEEIIKKLPGVQLNSKTGQITYKGKLIETVNLDGDNLFDKNYSIATKNINVDMVEKIEAIDNFSDNPLLKTLDTKEKVALNLVLKKNRYDFSGNIDGGVGLMSTSQPAFLSNNSLLGINSKLKSFAIASFNNLGLDFSPFGYYTSDYTPEALENKQFQAKRVIDKSIMNSFSEGYSGNFNNQTLLNPNALWKFNKKTSAKVNMYYINDHVTNRQENKNSYKLDYLEFETLDKIYSNRSSGLYRIDAEIKHNISDKTIAETSLQVGREKSLVLNYVEANKRITTNYNLFEVEKNIHFKSKLTHKINKSNALQLTIRNINSNLPQNLTFLSNVTPNDSITQLSGFRKNTFLSEIRLLGKAKNWFSYDLEVTFLKQKISYNSLLNNYLHNSISQINKNSLDTDRGIFVSSLLYKRKKWLVSIKPTVTYLKQKTKHDSNQTLEIPYIDWNTNIRYSFASKSSLNVSLSKTTTPFSEEYLFLNPVIVSNRTQVSNIPTLQITSTQKAHIFYNYFDLYSQFRVSLNFAGIKTNGLFGNNFLISENFTVAQFFFLSNQNTSFNSGFIVDKFVNLLKTNFKTEISHSRSTYQNRINSDSEIRNNIANNLSSTFTLRTGFSGVLNFEKSIDYQLFTAKGEEIGKVFSNSMLISKFKVLYNPKKIPVSFNYKTEIVVPNLGNSSSTMFLMDMSTRYRFKKKLELSMTYYNILNKTALTIVSPNDFGYSKNLTQIIPSYLLLGCSFNF